MKQINIYCITVCYSRHQLKAGDYVCAKINTKQNRNDFEMQVNFVQIQEVNNPNAPCLTRTFEDMSNNEWLLDSMIKFASNSEQPHRDLVSYCEI